MTHRPFDWRTRFRLAWAIIRDGQDCRYNELLAAATENAIEAQAAVTRARREALEALPTPAQFRELDDVLDCAIRDKHKQIEAMHSADWVRPPEFDITERDEVWLADFIRQGIEELSALRVTLRKLARLAGEAGK